MDQAFLRCNMDSCMGDFDARVQAATQKLLDAANFNNGWAYLATAGVWLRQEVARSFVQTALGATALSTCLNVAVAVYQAVNQFGCEPYRTAQQQTCRCR